MLDLPPLNALKAFECAARHLSFAAAAAELRVTAAAVSQQVRNLEAHYRRKLFRRLNNRILLTDAGQALLEGATPALEDISALGQRFAGGGGNRARLVVSVIPSLAECWFMPRFRAFALVHDGVRIELRVEPDPVDFSQGEVDLRIYYGAQDYAGLETVPLFRDWVRPVCAPRLMSGGVSMSAIDDNLLVHTSWGQEFGSHPGWDDWFRRFLPERRANPHKGHRAGSSRLAIDFARLGLGVALAQQGLAEEFVASGELAVMAEGALPLGQDYCAVFIPARRRKAGLRALLAHLQAGPGQAPLSPFATSTAK